MNIYTPEASEIPPITSKKESTRDVSVLRRVKRSVSLKKNDSEVNTLVRTNSKKILTPSPRLSNPPPFLATGMKDTRVQYLSDLRKIHECLKKTFNDPTKKIILTETNTLAIVAHDDAVINSEINEKVIDYIYKKILRAMITHIDYVFDDKGYPVTLSEIDKLAEFKFRDTWHVKKDEKSYSTSSDADKFTHQKLRDYQNFTKMMTQEELSVYYENKSMFLFGSDISEECEYISLISKLPLPVTSLKDAPKLNLLRCLSLFQRLYPLGGLQENSETPVMAPITFLCSYKNFVTTDELFEQILKAIELPEAHMPNLQKLRVLNVLRLWFESYLYTDEKITKKNKETIYSIITNGINSRKQEFVDLCYEIYFLLENRTAKNDPANISHSLNEPYEVEHMLNIEKNRNSRYQEFLNSITDEIKYAAAKTISNMPTFEIFDINSHENEASKFYNQLVSFGVSHFIKTFNAAVLLPTEQRIIKHKLNNFFEIFTDIAYMLEKKHDYLSSFAIYSMYNIAEFSLLLATKEPSKSINSKQRRLSLIKSSETQNRMQALDEVFSVSHNMECLRKKMSKCQDSHTYFVPFLGPIWQELIYSAVNSESFTTVSLEINNKKLHINAEKMWEVNSLLKLVKEGFKKQEITLNTDIGYHLIADGKYDEMELEALYKKLKIILK
jgi:hypothetical protein